MTAVPQILLNVKVKHKPDLNPDPGHQQAIKTAEATLNGSGRVLVRYRGPKPSCGSWSRANGIPRFAGRRSSREYCACPHRLATASCRRCRMLPTLTITFIAWVGARFPMSFLSPQQCHPPDDLHGRRAARGAAEALLLRARPASGSRVCVAAAWCWILYAWLAPHSPVSGEAWRLADPRHWNNRGLRSSCTGRQTALVRDIQRRSRSRHTVSPSSDLARPRPRSPSRCSDSRTHPPACAHGDDQSERFDCAAYLDQQGSTQSGRFRGRCGGGAGCRGPSTDTASLRLSEHWRALVKSAADSLSQPTRGLFLSLTIWGAGFLAPDARGGS